MFDIYVKNIKQIHICVKILSKGEFWTTFIEKDFEPDC